MRISFKRLNNLDGWLARYNTTEDGPYKWWFAWRPVFVYDDLVWLRWIYRYDRVFFTGKNRHYDFPPNDTNGIGEQP